MHRHRNPLDPRRPASASHYGGEFPSRSGAVPLGAPPEAEEAELEAKLEEEQEKNNQADYYAILNVSRGCSEEEIKASYRRLSMMYHPDKHRGEEAEKEMAERKFTLIHRAYDVLSDPTTRAIYDMYGEEGLGTMKEKLMQESMQVGPKLKSPEEIRAEYERERLKARRRKVNQLLESSQTDVQVKLDARKWFEGNATRRGLKELLAPSMEGLQISHSNELEITETDTFTLSGVILSRRGGRGGGYLLGVYNKQLTDRFWFQAEAAAGAASFVTLKTGGKLDLLSYYNCAATFSQWPWDGPPEMEMTYGRALSTSTSAYLTYRTGEWSLEDGLTEDSVELGVSHVHKKQQTKCSITAGLAMSSIQFRHTRPISKAASFQTYVTLSTAEGVLVGAGAERTIFSKDHRIGTTVECNLTSGITWKWKFSRLNQSLSIPIQLSSSYNGSALLFATLFPLTSVFAAQKLYWEPQLRRKMNRRMERIKEISKTNLEEKKREAAEAVLLLQESVAKKVRSEEAVQGLIVVAATYGKEGEGELVDVTIPLQSMVMNSQLHLAPGSSKSQMLGFYDPCPWVPSLEKRLSVRYRYKGRMHVVKVGDLEPLDAPLRVHLVPDQYNF